MLEIIKGLYILSTYDLPYLSISLSNILFSSQGSIKLSHPLDYYIIGPDNYTTIPLPPEISNLENSCFLYKLDTWSLGIIILECLSLQKVPFQNPELLQKYYLLSFLSMEFLQVAISEKFQKILQSLLCPDPISRYDIFDLITHPFFNHIPSSLSNTIDISHIYYLWLKYKNIDTIQKFEHYLIANGLLPYIPPVLQISGVVQLNSKEHNGIVILNRVYLNIENFLQEIKKDQDIETATVESKLFSEEISIKPESFIGKIGTIFRSKSAKSTHSESSIRSKKSETFGNIFKKYKKILQILECPVLEFIPVNSEGFPYCLRQGLWKRILKIPTAYQCIYDFLYSTRQIEPNKQIALDIPRCHQYNIYLSSSTGKRKLETLLKLWFSQHSGIKYSQGLDSIAAVCISCFEGNDSAAYFCFDHIVEKYLLNVIIHEELIGNFLLILRNLISFIDPVLSQHLNTQNINPEMYATSWLLTLYSRIL